MRRDRVIIPSEADEKRFFSFVSPIKNGCWLWGGAYCRNTTSKYGNFSIKGEGFQAHRVSFVMHNKKQIKPRMQIDHLCRNTLCVNPLHLEEVTPRENTLRGISPSAINKTKTHCKRGHELSGYNLIPIRTGRSCRACANLHAKNYREKMRVTALLIQIEEIEK